MSINFVRKGLGIWTTVIALLFLGIPLVGCKSKTPPPTHGSAAQTPSNSGLIGGSTDLIRLGDTLTITITDTPDKPVPFEDKVKEDGTITLMLNQTFVVTNKFTYALEKEIRERYVPDFYKNMTVTVGHQVSTRYYYVGGEVKGPGRQVYTGPITVTKAIQTAGDFTDFAAKTRVKLTRVDGRAQTVNCKKALVDARLDPEVFPGDKVTVPRRFW